MRLVGSVAGGPSFGLPKCVLSSVVVAPVVVLLLCLSSSCPVLVFLVLFSVVLLGL